MLKSFLIFNKNGAQSVEQKDVWKKKKDYPFLRFECYNEHAKIFLICLKFSAYKLCN
jgi:hypothetical protein